MHIEKGCAYDGECTENYQTNKQTLLIFNTFLLSK